MYQVTLEDALITIRYLTVHGCYLKVIVGFRLFKSQDICLWDVDQKVFKCASETLSDTFLILLRQKPAKTLDWPQWHEKGGTAKPQLFGEDKKKKI